jgi:hypothetical protein
MEVSDLLGRHIVGCHLVRHLLILTNYVPVDVRFDRIGNHVGSRVQSNDGVFADVEFDAEKDALELVINYGCNFRESLPLKFK